MTRRDEITHRALAMVDSGFVTRTCTRKPWVVELNDQRAPWRFCWALTTITAGRWAVWNDVGGAMELATLTPAGLRQLNTWDAELFDDPRCAKSSRPLSGLTTAQLDDMARALIRDAFNDTPKDPQ